MNREEQLLMMKDDIKIPESLNNIIDKEVKHYKTYYIVKKAYYLLMVLLLFGITCNLFPRVAYACKDIPVVKDFVKFICMDKGVKDCIDNDYAIYIHQTRGKNKRITLEYIIFDGTQLSFYFKGDEMTNIEQVEFIKGESSQTILYYDDFTRIQYVYEDIDEVDFLDCLSFKMNNETYQFDISLDKNKIKKEKIINVNKELNIEGQKILIDKVKVYPSVAMVYIKENLDNSMKLVNLEMAINEYGNVANGVSMKTEDEYLVYMIESPYFNDDFHLEIKTAVFCDKSDKYKINIKDKKIENAEDVSVEELVIKNDKLIIELSAPYWDINNVLVDSYYIDDKKYDCDKSLLVDAENNRISQTIVIPYQKGHQYYLYLNHHKSYHINHEILKKNID